MEFCYLDVPYTTRSKAIQTLPKRLKHLLISSNNLIIFTKPIAHEADQHAVRGRNKLIGRIPGCLIAFTIRLSISYGYEGFVSLKPKTTLIEHYITKYGFSQYGMYLAIYDEASLRLAAKYLGYEL